MIKVDVDNPVEPLFPSQSSQGKMMLMIDSPCLCFIIHSQQINNPYTCLHYGRLILVEGGKESFALCHNHIRHAATSSIIIIIIMP